MAMMAVTTKVAEAEEAAAAAMKATEAVKTEAAATAVRAAEAVGTEAETETAMEAEATIDGSNAGGNVKAAEMETGFKTWWTSVASILVEPPCRPHAPVVASRGQRSYRLKPWSPRQLTVTSEVVEPYRGRGRGDAAPLKIRAFKTLKTR